MDGDGGVLCGGAVGAFQLSRLRLFPGAPAATCGKSARIVSVFYGSVMRAPELNVPPANVPPAESEVAAPEAPTEPGTVTIA
jgi:hypothetical protein